MDLKTAFQIISQKDKGFKGKKHSEETKRKIGESKRLSDVELRKRQEDYNQDDKSYGMNSRLAKKWGITRQKAGVFIKKHLLTKPYK